MLEEIGIDYNEGEHSIEKIGSYPYLVFWDYIWEDISASNSTYDTKVTYQVSVFADNPPRNNQELIKLLNKLRDCGIRPIVNHEYDLKEKVFHTFFSLELLENVSSI